MSKKPLPTTRQKGAPPTAPSRGRRDPRARATDASAPSSPVAAALRELAALDRATLVARWMVAFGCPAPRHVQAPLLRLALGWHLQLEQLEPTGHGGSLRHAIVARPPVRPTVRPTVRPKPRPLAPGTRLLREWQGATHHVTVGAAGFAYRGATYRSLSAIARRITGTAWSGPLFFGLSR
jgi:Protein of unknown function (DUF2924)